MAENAADEAAAWAEWRIADRTAGAVELDEGFDEGVRDRLTFSALTVDDTSGWRASLLTSRSTVSSAQPCIMSPAAMVEAYVSESCALGTGSGAAIALIPCYMASRTGT